MIIIPFPLTVNCLLEHRKWAFGICSTAQVTPNPPVNMLQSIYHGQESQRVLSS
jgi:hypothetical protein